MRSRTSTWFICKVRYTKVTDGGTEKKVTEPYVVNALSFTEAEARIMKEMAQYVSGAFDIADISHAPFSEIFFTEDGAADKWYKSKLQFVTIDEKTEKEKKTTVTYLVQADSLEGARKNVDEVMAGTMIDYVITAVNETAIMDVFECTDDDKKEYES